jgi:hypothetical protein
VSDIRGQQVEDESSEAPEILWVDDLGVVELYKPSVAGKVDSGSTQRARRTEYLCFLLGEHQSDLIPNELMCVFLSQIKIFRGLYIYQDVIDG